MRFLTLGEVVELHRRVLRQSGSSPGIRTLSGIESAIALPQSTVGGEDAYPSIVEKSAALGYGLCQNHGFIDGNKRVAHAAMETFLFLNGLEIEADVDEQEKLVLSLAAGNITIQELSAWLKDHTVRVKSAT